ncbi:MAG: twin-arginine translocation signal domain-containing protein, partial [Burkholderiales bacterium]
MKLIKIHEDQAPGGATATGRGLSRRAFLRNSGLAAGGAALGTAMAPGMMKRAEAAKTPRTGEIKTVRTVCTHCSVGCGIYAEVQNGV